MDDVVAVRIDLDDSAAAYFLTWGRLYDAVDPRPLAYAVLRVSDRFAIGGTAIGAKVCESLQEASPAPAFFESFYKMCQGPIPFGAKYSEWRRKKIASLASGGDLWFVGKLDAHGGRDADVLVADGYEPPPFLHDAVCPFEQPINTTTVPWCEDELGCHRWNWDGHEWVISNVAPATICDERGSDRMRMVDHSHVVCIDCGRTEEIASEV